MAFYKHENVDIRIARIFNTFGPRMHINDGRVVSNFITQSLQGMPITVKKYLNIFYFIQRFMEMEIKHVHFNIFLI